MEEKISSDNPIAEFKVYLKDGIHIIEIYHNDLNSQLRIVCDNRKIFERINKIAFDFGGKWDFEIGGQKCLVKITFLGLGNVCFLTFFIIFLM